METKSLSAVSIAEAWGGCGRDRIELFEALSTGGLSVEGYEPLANRIEGDLEKAAPELLLRLLARGVGAVSVLGSD